MCEIRYKIMRFFGFDFGFIVDYDMDNDFELRLNEEEGAALLKFKKELGRKWLTRKSMAAAIADGSHPELEPIMEAIDEECKQLYLEKWLEGVEDWDDTYEEYLSKDIEDGLYDIDEAIGIFVYENLCGCDDEVAEKFDTKEKILASDDFIRWNKDPYYEWVDENEDVYFRAMRYGFWLEDLDLEFLNYRIRIV